MPENNVYMSQLCTALAVSSGNIEVRTTSWPFAYFSELCAHGWKMYHLRPNHPFISKHTILCTFPDTCIQAHAHRPCIRKLISVRATQGHGIHLHSSYKNVSRQLVTTAHSLAFAALQMGMRVFEAMDAKHVWPFGWLVSISGKPWGRIPQAHGHFQYAISHWNGVNMSVCYWAGAEVFLAWPYTAYSACMSPENTHKLMGFYVEVFILGIIL